MKRSLNFWQFAGFVFTSVLGTLLHFLYDWTQSTTFGLFSAVNESIWEHMKLLFVPMLIFSIIESFYLAKQYDNFWCYKPIGIIIGLIIIPMLYYTYTGALGVSTDWFNIAIFFIAAAIAYTVEARLLKSKNNFHLSKTAIVALLCFLCVLFIVFTFSPPHIPLFKDPLTGAYGLA